MNYLQLAKQIRVEQNSLALEADKAWFKLERVRLDLIDVHNLINAASDAEKAAEASVDDWMLDQGL